MIERTRSILFSSETKRIISYFASFVFLPNICDKMIILTPLGYFLSFCVILIYSPLNQVEAPDVVTSFANFISFVSGL